ncbi:hypothetical protein AAFC00_001211 [Neodothiora populina]|uniref:Xylose isomerase-like TIM barrel domain-containing protein n=1 Tax=Neodothiora populina TaxID=2781224 RepID=A0ABR3PNF4_9PEZI
MPPRIPKKPSRQDSSDLSSAPPSVIRESDQGETAVSAPASRGTKRKRVTRDKTVIASAKNGTAVTKGAQVKEESVTQELPSPKRSRRARKDPDPQAAEQEGEEEEILPAKKARKAPAPKKEQVVKEEEAEPSTTATEKKTPKKRKTKEEKEAEMQPLRGRNPLCKVIIGAHVSAAGGVGNAVTNSLHIGANAFALFLKSQRKWANPPLEDSVASIFLDKCKKHDYQQNKNVVPHGSYLVNLAHTDKDRTKQAYDSFLDDIKRCEKLGIRLYNFHPGNCLTTDRAEAIAHLASNLNRAHKETSTVITLLENMAAGGNVLGSTFEDLRDIIAHVQDKSRVGVCLDTCHAFAGGYDLRTPAALDKTLSEFDDIVGLNYLRAVHLNDSKAPFSSNRDLHANIGTGFLGLRAFHAIVNDSRFHNLPMVLETPIDVRDDDGNILKDEKGKDREDRGIWAGEIEMLEGLVGTDVTSDEFTELEEKLSKRGRPERERIQKQVDSREEKKQKVKAGAKAKAGKKGGKKKQETSDEESELSDLD